MKSKNDPSPAQPKRKRARCAQPVTKTGEPIETGYSEEDLHEIDTFVQRKLMYRLYANEARRHGACHIRPRDYFCCGTAAPPTFRPVCSGDKPDCPFQGSRSREVYDLNNMPDLRIDNTKISKIIARMPQPAIRGAFAKKHQKSQKGS